MSTILSSTWRSVICGRENKTSLRHVFCLWRMTVRHVDDTRRVMPNVVRTATTFSNSSTISTPSLLAFKLSLTLWRPLLPNGYSYKASCARLSHFDRPTVGLPKLLRSMSLTAFMNECGHWSDNDNDNNKEARLSQRTTARDDYRIWNVQFPYTNTENLVAIRDFSTRIFL